MKAFICTGEFTLQFDKYRGTLTKRSSILLSPIFRQLYKIGVQKVYEMKEVFLIISCDEARESQHNGEGGFFPSPPQCSLNVIEGAERK